MIKTIKSIVLISAATILTSCGGGGGGEAANEAPSGVNLEYPTADLLCIENTITFNWSNATDPNNDAISYKLVIAKNRDLTDGRQEKTVSTSQETITLDKDVAYYWNVTAVDEKGLAGQASATYAFYTKGDGESNFVPFTAELGAPADEATISGTTVTLSWTGADANTGDSLTYDVYFGEDAANLTTKVVDAASATSHDQAIESGKTYYWKVNTTDAAGATSIGQIWSFTVN